MISKLIDWIDTYLIVLTKKSETQLSFLHTYHHSTMGIIWCYLIVNDYAFGTVTFGALCNSFVHCVMYTHYLVTSFGIRNPFKKWVTRIQMLQFAFCFIHNCVGPFYETVNDAPWQLQLFYQTTMLILFNNFSKRTYGKEQPVKKQQ